MIENKILPSRREGPGAGPPPNLLPPGGGTIILAAGGTGGHVFPAIATAVELERRGYKIIFLSDRRGEKYLKSGGYPYKIISSASPSGNPLKKLSSTIRLGWGVVQAGFHIMLQRPKVVIGFGGYPSFPPLLAAKLLGIKTVLHEQNSILGKANRFLAKYANIIATSFPETKTPGQLQLTGNPVRGEIAEQPYPPISDKLNILITGGSQGAKLFADILTPALGLFAGKIRVTQQVRDGDMDKVKAGYLAAGLEHELKNFFDDMPERLKNAQLVICRAGASTVFELAAIGRPALMVPLAISAENHQYHNARAISDIGGGWLLEEKNFNTRAISDIINTLLLEPEKLTQAAENIKKFAAKNAAGNLADLAIGLINK